MFVFSNKRNVMNMPTVREIEKKRDLFPAEKHATMDGWIIRFFYLNELDTDDTYQFARTMRKVCDILKQRKDFTTPQEDVDVQEALIEVMKTAIGTNSRNHYINSTILCNQS